GSPLMPRLAAALVAVLALGCRVIAAEPVPPTFNAHVRPLLKAYCFECHGEGEKLKGGLDLRLRRLLVKGGDSGASIVGGKPDEGRPTERGRGGEMPPSKKKRTAAEIEVLKRWIAAGAKVEAPEPETITQGFVISDDDRRWWAFRPIQRSAIP